MNCYQFRLKISPYLDTELTYSELQSFREHLENCPHCADMTTQMERIRVTLGESLPVSLAPDFVARLQSRLQTEINRDTDWWRKLLTPRVMGFSPIHLGGLAAAAMALMIIGVGLFQPESAPLVDPPKASGLSNPSTVVPSQLIPPTPTQSPLLTTSTGDTTLHQQDSSRRDFSRQIRYVNQERNP
ncbi:anti-sigma factor family protein [Candidatus Neomarinimicrobiota bacterium]